jgi:hypothetical protein
MNLNRFVLSFLGFLAFTHQACREIEIPDDIGLRYFPIQIGDIRFYQVDSIHYNSFSESADTFNFFEKYSIVSKNTRDEFTDIYEVKVERSLALDSGWNLSLFALYEVDKHGISEIRSNVRVLKLLFPIKERKSWDANMNNTLPLDRYQYRNVDVKGSSLLGVHDFTITVEQENDSSFLLVNKRYELYADGIGMVRSFQDEREYQTTYPEGARVIKQLLPK